MRFSRVQSGNMPHFQIPIESMIFPIWSMHFYGLVSGCADFFHANFPHSNRQDVRHGQRFGNHGFALPVGHRCTKNADTSSSLTVHLGASTPTSGSARRCVVPADQRDHAVVLARRHTARLEVHRAFGAHGGKYQVAGAWRRFEYLDRGAGVDAAFDVL